MERKHNSFQQKNLFHIFKTGPVIYYQKNNSNLYPDVVENSQTFKIISKQSSKVFFSKENDELVQSAAVKAVKGSAIRL